MSLAKTKNILNKYWVGVIAVCVAVYASVLFWRYGTGMIFIQGLVLLFVLIYASVSDIRTRTVGDFVSVEILILTLIYFPIDKLLSSIIGATIILVSQMILILAKRLVIGGADIKITTAAAFLLGIEKGLSFYCIGFVLAMLYALIHSLKMKGANVGTPMIPFFSIGILIMFLV